MPASEYDKRALLRALRKRQKQTLRELGDAIHRPVKALPVSISALVKEGRAVVHRGRPNRYTKG